MTQEFKELLGLDKALNETCSEWRANSTEETERAYDNALNDFEYYVCEHRDDFTDEELLIIEYSYANSCTVAEAVGAFENDEF